jgi:hypothetical protein
MRYFFDTEFFEDGKTIDLISIGVVAEDGRTFYAISSEFDVDRVLDDPWMRDHVWSFIKDDYEHGNTLSREEIAVKFLDFVAPHHHWDILHMNILPFDSPYDSELWGYYCAYDWVAVRQLYGKMINGPRGLPHYCNDIMQYRGKLGEIALPRIPESDRHHALADAEEVKLMFEYLREVEANK